MAKGGAPPPSKAMNTGPTDTMGPPNSVLWAPLPIVSWLLPGVGHVAISDSQGNIHDFAGSYLINVRPQSEGPNALNSVRRL